MEKVKRSIDKNEPFLELYTAIFQQAVKDDIAFVCGLLRREMGNRLYSQGYKNRFFKNRLPEIEKKIMKNVFTEVSDWPSSDHKAKDKKLTEIYKGECKYLNEEIKK